MGTTARRRSPGKTPHDHDRVGALTRDPVRRPGPSVPTTSTLNGSPSRASTVSGQLLTSTRSTSVPLLRRPARGHADDRRHHDAPTRARRRRCRWRRRRSRRPRVRTATGTPRRDGTPPVGRVVRTSQPSGHVDERGSERGEAAVGVLLDRADRAPEGVGGLLLGPVGQVAQDDHLPLAAGQAAAAASTRSMRRAASPASTVEPPEPPAGPGLPPAAEGQVGGHPGHPGLGVRRTATSGRRPGPGPPGPPPRRPRPTEDPVGHPVGQDGEVVAKRLVEPARHTHSQPRQGLGRLTRAIWCDRRECH